MSNEQVNQILDLSTKYQPLRADVVVMLPTKAEIDAITKSKSGVIGGKDKVKDLIYTVVAVGPKCLEIKKFDKILLRFSSGIPCINIDGVDYGQVDEFQVLGKIASSTLTMNSNNLVTNPTGNGSSL